MRLMCRLRGHWADPIPARWNGNRCFTTCMACGCDLVRTPDTEWQVPRGYRVVWRPMPKQVATIATGTLEAEQALPEPPIAEPPATAAEDEAFSEVQMNLELMPAVHAEADHGGADEPCLEWPIEPPAPLQQIEESEAEVSEAEVIVEAYPPPEETVVHQIQAKASDFMDDQFDDFDWDDFSEAPRRSAAG